MPRTGKYAGQISTLTYTPSGGSLTTFTGAIDAKPIINDQLVEYTGDAALFATAMASVKGSRGLQISGYDVSQFLRSLPKGPGTLVVVVNDIYNGTGTGALTYTLSNAMRQDASASHANQSANAASVTYMGYSSNGTTDPLAIAEAS